MNIRSIHVRLVLWHTALVILISALFGGYTYHSLDHRLTNEMKETLSRRVEHLRDDILEKDLFSQPKQEMAQKIQDVYSPEENDRFIRISKGDGTILYVSGRPRDPIFNPARIPLPHGYTTAVSEQIEQLRSGEHLMLVGFTAPIAGTDYIIEMGAPTDQIDIPLHKLLITLLIGLPVVALMAVIGGLMLVRRALLPVEMIRATAENISFGNLSQRLPVPPTGDALERLSSTLNRMLERLETAYQQASRFSADASHELRTPLTIMRGELESIGSIMYAEQPTQLLYERIGSVLEEAEHLSRIVEGLFAIARLEAGEARMGHEVFDLAELARSTVEQMQLLAEDKNLSITIDAANPVFVMGDAPRLKQVIVNLFDNAIKYTPDGGAIALSVSALAAKAVFAVKDNGAGIAPDALPHIFERFYRSEKARSSSAHGAGLGLSIVRSICQAHGGTVNVQSAEGKGATVTVELPLAAAHNQENAHARA